MGNYTQSNAKKSSSVSVTFNTLEVLKPPISTGHLTSLHVMAGYWVACYGAF